MKTADEDQRPLETRRKLKRFEIGPEYVWNREEIYEDRMPPRHKHPDPDRSGKKE